MMQIKMDTKEFDAALNEYMQFAKKAPSEILNAKCYYIARQCTFTTKAADKNAIRSELNAPSRTNSDVSLAVILAQKRAIEKNGKGLNSNELKKAVKSFIAARIRSVNFLRSGWLPAIRILDNALKRGDVTFAKRFAPKQNNAVKQYGADKGTAIWARKDTPRCFAEIENDVEADGNSKVHEYLIVGLQEAINREVQSMRQYIDRKYNEYIDKWNKKKR